VQESSLSVVYKSASDIPAAERGAWVFGFTSPLPYIETQLQTALFRTF